jgi:hypothetical protein
MPSKTLGATTQNYDLGNSGGAASRKVIELNVGSLTGSFAVQGRLSGAGGTYIAIPYKKHYLNGAVGDETYVTTAITGNSLIEVPSTGLDVRLAYTHTSGTVGTGYLQWLDMIG